MEKIKNFPEIIQVLFDSNTEDCDPGDLLTKAEKLLFDDQKFEAFLLASFLYECIISLSVSGVIPPLLF